MKRTLIRDAEVVFPSGCFVTNVLIIGGKIAAIDAPPTVDADEKIDGKGLLLFPGLIDDQVHFREPGLTHKEDLFTASTACAAGGVTTYLEMPNTIPAAINENEIRAKYQLAAKKSAVNYGFYIGATTQNIVDLKSISNVPGIKIFIGSSTGDLLVDDQEALERIFAETTLPICAHCEDESTVQTNRKQFGNRQNVSTHSMIRDVKAAVIATTRAVDLAMRHKHRFHVLHVSTADEIPIFADSRPFVTAEACPHHLFFDTRDYDRLGTKIQMNPSIKPAEHPPALWQALLDGKIQVIATDHAPHTLEEKSASYPASPSGLPAVENYFALLLDSAQRKGFSYSQLASWCADAPARIWGLVGKGRIAVGYDADLVLVDPQRTRTIKDEEQFTKCKWSPWAGVTLTGWPVQTFVKGESVFKLPVDHSFGEITNVKASSAVLCDHALGGYWATTDGVGPNTLDIV